MRRGADLSRAQGHPRHRIHASPGGSGRRLHERDARGSAMSIGAVTQWIDDKINPIVVKELRQAVQSKFVVITLLLFLILQLLIVGIFLVVESGSRGMIGSMEGQAGRQLFGILQTIMLATCMLFIP